MYGRRTAAEAGQKFIKAGIIVRVQSTGEYIEFLNSKGIYFNEQQIGFIYFGRKYTGISDQMINNAIELTLKVQREFDGSFYIGLLEVFKEKNIDTYDLALEYIYSTGILKETVV
jgi:hypothetical protein